MAIKVITPPAAEPVSLAEAKLQCRVDIADDDTLISGLITAARETVESIANRALVTQTLELVLDAFPARETLALPRPPLASVTSVSYTDDAGVTATFDASSYIVDPGSQPGRIGLKSGYTWPTTTLQAIAGVRVRYVAGYGLAVAVPAKFKQAMLLLIAHWYEHREEIQDGALDEIPFGVTALLWLDRVKKF